MTAPATTARRSARKAKGDGHLRRAEILEAAERIFIAEGYSFHRNDPLVLIEAMKMEIPICAAVDGTVKSVCVAAGETVSARQVLLEFV